MFKNAQSFNGHKAMKKCDSMMCKRSITIDGGQFLFQSQKQLFLIKIAFFTNFENAVKDPVFP